MKNTCKEKLHQIEMNGTRVDKKIAQFLFSNKGEDISKINDLSDGCDISLSTAHRFIIKIGYPTFKHFYYEFKDIQLKESECKTTNSYINEVYEQTVDVISKIKGDIFIISSRRGKSIGKLFNERLNDGNIKNVLYSESKDNLQQFVKSSANNTLILISLSGYSNIFSKAIEEIAKLPIKDKPNVIILTAAQWMKIFEKYSYISIGKIYHKKYDLDDWKEYNSALLDVMTTITIMLNELWRIRHLEK